MTHVNMECCPAYQLWAPRSYWRHKSTGGMVRTFNCISKWMVVSLDQNCLFCLPFTCRSFFSSMETHLLVSQKGGGGWGVILVGVLRKEWLGNVLESQWGGRGCLTRWYQKSLIYRKTMHAVYSTRLGAAWEFNRVHSRNGGYWGYLGGRSSNAYSGAWLLKISISMPVNLVTATWCG